MNYEHKGLTMCTQLTKVKNTDYYKQNAIKKCNEQTAEYQAGTSKGKLTNTKLLAPRLT